MQVSHGNRCASSPVTANRISRTRALPAKDDDDPERWLWTSTIITTDAAGPAGEIHNRTPLILPADRVDAWLDPTLTDTSRLQTLLTGVGTGDLEVRPVSPAVNKVSNNRPELIDPMDSAADRPLQLALA